MYRTIEDTPRHHLHLILADEGMYWWQQYIESSLRTYLPIDWSPALKWVISCIAWNFPPRRKPQSCHWYQNETYYLEPTFSFFVGQRRSLPNLGVSFSRARKSIINPGGLRSHIVTMTVIISKHESRLFENRCVDVLVNQVHLCLIIEWLPG